MKTAHEVIAAMRAEIEREQRRLSILSTKDNLELRRDAAIQNGAYQHVLSLLDTLEAESTQEKLVLKNELTGEVVVDKTIPEHMRGADPEIAYGCTKLLSAGWTLIAPGVKEQDLEKEELIATIKEWERDTAGNTEFGMGQKTALCAVLQRLEAEQELPARVEVMGRFEGDGETLLPKCPPPASGFGASTAQVSPQGLDEAADSFAQEHFRREYFQVPRDGMRASFKAGAEWMAGQGSTIKARVDKTGIFHAVVTTGLREALVHFKNEEEVIIQIRKK